MKGQFFKVLNFFLNNEAEANNFSQYKIMKKFNVSQSTAKKIKECLNMKIKEAKFLKKMSGEIEVEDHKMIPIVLYLLKENNFFKSTQEIIFETGYSRYLVNNARNVIEVYIKEHYSDINNL